MGAGGDILPDDWDGSPFDYSSYGDLIQIVSLEEDVDKASEEEKVMLRSIGTLPAWQISSCALQCEETIEAYIYARFFKENGEERAELFVLGTDRDANMGYAFLEGYKKGRKKL